MRAFVVLLLSGAACSCNGPSPKAAAPSEGEAIGAPTNGASVGDTETALSSQVRRATLMIEGMVCQGCAEAARQALERIDGVVSADTDFQVGTATVAFDPSKTSVDALAAAIEGVDRDPAPAFRVTARTGE